MSTKRITMAALLALLWAPAWPAAAQVDVGAGGEPALPWAERLRLADPQGELRVTIALPPPDAAAPAEGFPVLYYTGTDADALMIDAMRRIGGVSAQAVLVGVQAGDATRPVDAARVDRAVRPRIAERHRIDPAREQYFALTPAPDGWAPLLAAPARPFQTYVLAATACLANDDAAVAALQRLERTDVLLVSPGGCATAAGFRDPAAQASPAPRRYHLALENRDPVTLLPEAMVQAITVRISADLEDWRRDWISRR